MIRLAGGILPKDKPPEVVSGGWGNGGEMLDAAIRQARATCVRRVLRGRRRPMEGGSRDVRLLTLPFRRPPSSLSEYVQMSYIKLY